jgi:predicted metalloenzyme YecM
MLFLETIVSGRKVCIYRLDEPLIYDGFSILSIELLYPKAGKLWSGWDHLEVVIPPYTNSLDKFCKSFYQTFPCFLGAQIDIVESIHTF